VALVGDPAQQLALGRPMASDDEEGGRHVVAGQDVEDLLV